MTQDHGDYCPFLNRADDRCSTHFQLDRLGDAFEQCFGGYHECAVYQELLRERRARRAAAAAETRHHSGITWPDARVTYAPRSAKPSLVTLTVSGRFACAEAAD